MISTIERVPPQNLEAEQAVLGSMLLERDAIAKVVELIQPGDFYRDAHRKIYVAVAELFEKGEPVDLISLTDRLRDRGELDDVGGAAYLGMLLNTVPTAANVEFYARIVMQKALLRGLISAGTTIAQLGYNAEGDVEILIDQAEKLVFAIGQRRMTQEFVPIRSVLMETFEKLDQRGKGDVTGIPTGFTDLDLLTAGLQPSDLVIVAGRPSMGKTTFGLNIAQHAAIHHKTPVAIFSLETSKEQLVQRILCAEAGVDNSRLRTGFLTDDDWRRISRAVGVLSEAKIFVDDSANITPIEMRAKARKLMAEHGLGLIIIDYIQLIQSYRRTENRTQEISEIARSLKGLAKELNIPVIITSQLSRAVEMTGTRRPMLSHLRESGELEQVADLVVFLYRDDYYDPATEKKNVAEVIVAKHRNGPTGTIELYFHREHSQFANLERRRT